MKIDFESKYFELPNVKPRAPPPARPAARATCEIHDGFEGFLRVPAIGPRTLGFAAAVAHYFGRRPLANYGAGCVFYAQLDDFRVSAGSRTLGFRAPAARYLARRPLAT